jgi:hypothetical protein
MMGGGSNARARGNAQHADGSQAAAGVERAAAATKKKSVVSSWYDTDCKVRMSIPK